MPTTELIVKGMVCQGCVQSVEKALKRNPEIKEVQIDLSSGKTKILHTPAVQLEEMKAILSKSGFSGESVS